MRTALPAALAALTLLSACSFAPRKPFTPDPPRADSAALYFYRPSEMTARLLKPTLSANGAELGRLPNDAYAVAYVPAGGVELRSQWPGVPGSSRDDKVSLSVEAGKSYFLRVRYQTRRAKQLTPGIKGLGGLSFEDRVGLEQVADSEAVTQMAGMARADGFQAAPK